MKPMLKGGLVAALIGCVTLVLSNQFKGNLAEPGFLANYLGYLSIYVIIGSMVSIYSSRRRKQSMTDSLQQTPQNRFLFIASVLAVLFIVGKVIVDFPSGAGLLHPTHAALAEQTKKICLEKQAGNTSESPTDIEKFCSCFADKLADVALAELQEAPQVAAQKAAAACRSPGGSTLMDAL